LADALLPNHRLSCLSARSVRIATMPAANQTVTLHPPREFHERFLAWLSVRAEVQSWPLQSSWPLPQRVASSDDLRSATCDQALVADKLRQVEPVAEPESASADGRGPLRRPSSTHNLSVGSEHRLTC
jgi:hypothetical protein